MTTMQKFILPPVDSLIDSLTEADAAKEDAKTASGTSTAASGGVTESVIKYAELLAQAADGKVILGDGRKRTSWKGESTEAHNTLIAAALREAGVEKGNASKMGKLAAWLAKYPDYKSHCFTQATEKSPSRVKGWQAAFKSVQQEVEGVSPEQKFRMSVGAGLRELTAAMFDGGKPLDDAALITEFVATAEEKKLAQIFGMALENEVAKLGADVINAASQPSSTVQ